MGAPYSDLKCNQSEKRGKTMPREYLGLPTRMCEVEGAGSF